LLEYELFLNLFTDDDLRSFAKKIGVTNWGNTPINKIPLPVLKGEIKKAFIKGINKGQGPINVRKQLKYLGIQTIKQYDLPRLMSEELLMECATREEIPEPQLLGYLYVCDEMLYNEKIKEWLEDGWGEGRLFEKYTTEMSPDDYLIKMFNPDRFIDGKILESIGNKLEDIEVPQQITINDIIHLKTPSDKSAKMLLRFLKSEEGEKHPFKRDLFMGLAAWALSNERNLLFENLKEINKQNQDLLEKNEDLELNLLRLQDKQSKTIKTLKEREDTIKTLQTEKQELTTNVKQLEKLQDKIANEKKVSDEEFARIKKQQNELFQIFHLTPDVNPIKSIKAIMEHVELLNSIIPEPSNIVIAADPKWHIDITDLIPRDCIVSVDYCMNNAWCEKNEGKILYLHRQSYGNTMDFENSFNFFLEKNINVVEINAVDRVEWLREIIRREIR